MSETQTTLRDQLTAAYDEHVEAPAEIPAQPTTQVETEKTAEERARDEKGRFAEQKTESQKKPEDKTIAAAAALQRPPRPSAWKKDYEKDWETLDPRLAAYINQRESEFAKGVSTYKQEWDRAKPILDAIAPFQQQFQQYGIQPDQWVRTLGAAHQALALGTPQQKLAMFAKLAQDYGVPLQALLPRPPQVGPDGQPVPQPQFDPRLAMWLQQQIGGMRGELQQWKTAQAEGQAAQIAKEIEAFAKDHPHYEALKETMAEVLEKGLATDLDGAHSIAMRMPQHDDIWTASQEEKRKADEAKRAEEARLAAVAAKKKAVSPKSSSPGSAKATDGKKSLRDQYAEALEASTGRV